MKKILLGTMLLLATAALAETVSSVSYNPSRLGDYQYLKVSDSAKLKGGLATQALNLNSGGYIRLTNDTTANSYTVGNITGSQENGMYMSNALWRNANTSGNSYAVSTTNPAGQIPTITVFGGTMNFSSDSFVNNLTAQNNNLYEYAGKLNVAGTMAVTGNSDGEEKNLAGAGMSLLSTTTSGMVLGNKSIPYPKNVLYADADGNHGTANLSLTGSNCKFEWVQRAINSSTPSAVWVLALTGCTVSGGCVETPVHYETVSADCIPPYSGTATYRVARWTRCVNGEEVNEQAYVDANNNTVSSPAWDYNNCVTYCWKKTGQGNYGSHWLWSTSARDDTWCSGLSVGQGKLLCPGAVTCSENTVGTTTVRGYVKLKNRGIGYPWKCQSVKNCINSDNQDLENYKCIKKIFGDGQSCWSYQGSVGGVCSNNPGCSGHTLPY